MHASPLQLGAMSIRNKWQEFGMGSMNKESVSKFWTLPMTMGAISQRALYARNSTKSLHAFVEASLKKQRTTYIDLLYLYWWDWETSVEEVMRSFDVLLRRGKFLYLVNFTSIL